MHQSSLEHIQRLVVTHLDRNKPLSIIDIGSYDVNGSYKIFFDSPNWNYKGIDLTHGPNVDIVMSSPYRLPLPSHSVDVIVSGQAFEHIEFFWLTWQEMTRILKPGGCIFLVAPSRGPEHRFPQDCWRFYPDSYRALASFGGLELAECTTDWSPHADVHSAPWGDTVGVFRQPAMNWIKRKKKILIQHIRYWTTPGYRL